MCIQWCFKVNSIFILFIYEFFLWIFLSTLSSGLNSLAAVVHSDIIKFFYRKPMTDKQDLWYSKMLCKSFIEIFLLEILHLFFFFIALVFGVVCILITYLVSLLGNLLQATLSLFGVLSGPISAIFMIGFFLPWINSAVD
jgi:Na+/proline symporter